MRDRYWFALIVLLILGPTIFGVLYFASRTEKIVTVKEKWIKESGGSMKYLFSDQDGNVYSIEDAWVFLKFEASDRWAKLDVGKTYKLTLYGWRIYFFSWYQNAVWIEEVKS